MTFRIGQKVVCVDAIGSELIFGGVYTIQQVIRNLSRWRGVVGNWSAVQLYEAAAESPYVGFCSERFKPFDERPTDISIFKEMLVEAVVP